MEIENRIGTVLDGKYRLESVIGRGGFGVVYAGVHKWTGREIAVKVLKTETAQTPEHLKRFLQEAQAVARLEHRNVVDVLDMGQAEDGTFYMVLERLRGEELHERLGREGKLSLEETVEILAPVMEALGEAHHIGIVHRDLKPSNIFLHVDSKERMTPKLLDFGIAKVRDSSMVQTATGDVLGTPKYMSREQLKGATELGPASDVWSMAVVLWACLAGKTPFEGDNAHVVLAKILTERAAPFSTAEPELAGPIAEVIDRALDPDPSVRFADMAEMREVFLDAVARHEPTLSAKEPERAGELAASAEAEAPDVAGALPATAVNEAAVSLGEAPTEVARADVPITSSRKAIPRTVAMEATPQTVALSSGETPLAVVAPSGRERSRWPIALAVVALGLVGGATFLGVRFGVGEEPPDVPAASEPPERVAPPELPDTTLLSAEPPVAEPAIEEQAAVPEEPAAEEPAVAEPAIEEAPAPEAEAAPEQTEPPSPAEDRAPRHVPRAPRTRVPPPLPVPVVRPLGPGRPTPTPGARTGNNDALILR